MDGKVSQLAEVFESVLGNSADELAGRSGVIKRTRKLTGSLLVKILVLSWWHDPNATWEDLADNAFRWFGLEISAAALNDRAKMPTFELLQRLFDQALEAAVTAEPTTVPILSRFNGVEVHDGTTIALPNDLCEQFPGCGNQHNPEAAAMKAVVRMEVLSGQLSAVRFGSGRQADTKLGPELPTPPAGSLTMCDRGFFDVGELKRWHDAGAFFLMRPVTGVSVARVYDNGEAGELQDLSEYLRSQPVNVTRIDRHVQITKDRFGCRLIAVRCPEEVANRRRQKLRETWKRKGRGKPSRKQLVMCDWFVLITNVPQKKLSVQDACVAYRVRWQIELLFKSYKSDSGLDKSRARTGSSRLVELMAKWLARALEHILLAPTGGPLAKISWRARVKRMANWIAEIARVLSDRAALIDVIQQVNKHLKRLRPKAQRKTKPGTLDFLLHPKWIEGCLS